MGALIELKNIGYSYHTLSGETDAIKDISFSVEEGEFVALVGPAAAVNPLCCPLSQAPRP